MKRFTLIALLLSVVLFQACSTKVYNNTAWLDQVNLEGKRVAILPAVVELTGRMPANFNESKIRQTEESESKLIQQEFYNQYLFKSKKNKRKQYVELMNVEQVNSKLQQQGIDIRESWKMSPDSLGKLLGADMVLKLSVKKNRIMSDAASFGIGVATTVLGNILNNGQNTSVNNGAKTYNMFLDATLTDVNTHTVITKFIHDGDASWNRPPEKIVEASGRKIVRKGVIYAQK